MSSKRTISAEAWRSVSMPARGDYATVPVSRPTAADTASAGRSTATCERRTLASGFTLVEILIVVAILTAFAVAFLSGTSSHDEVQLEYATQEIVSAIRFARSEAMRTGIAHGVRAKPNEQLVQAYRITPGSNPTERIYDVRHPHDKQVIDFTLGVTPGMESVTLESTAFDYIGHVDKNRLDFRPDGSAYFEKAGVEYVIATAAITLSSGPSVKIITIDTATGRVSVSP